MKYKIITKLQLRQEKNKLLKIVDSEKKADILLKMKYYLTFSGMKFYISKIFEKKYKYRKNYKNQKTDIYMTRTCNNLDYHLYISFSKDKVTPVDSLTIDIFNNNIVYDKGAIIKVYLSISGFTLDAQKRADYLGIILFGSNEILGLEKTLAIDDFIKYCKSKRVYNKYISNIKLEEEKIESGGFLTNNYIKNLFFVLNNRRYGLISRTQNDIKLILKEVRNLIARENKIQSYMVFSNKTLEEIIRKKPTTTRELADIKGIETYIIEKYGNFIIKVLV